ncbi:MAG: hypothetical protein ACRBHB_23150 [Arenicella sp.]
MPFSSYIQGLRRQLPVIGIVIWVSFVGASIATMLFFATFDPELLASFATYPIELSRTAGYSLGFLLFWLLLASNGLIIAWMTLNPKITEKHS